MNDNGWKTNNMVQERRQIQKDQESLQINDEQFYEGKFQNGIMLGKEKELLHQEIKNVIEENGKRVKCDGFGIMKWDDGKYYEGNFDNGKQNGDEKFVHEQMDNRKEKEHIKINNVK
ncbi:unnamed protein product [Paramecium sonneborni]|uniref:MORN repeat protein n=1 Tax=Paramecium sonneborni TaxID=65129 RepID=A0A8S1MUP9_9CILI|nr:unnamed protein product [Paramecium sonneborni]